MLKGIHFLLTYKCIYECDHCFVYSSPNAEGTFTLEQINSVLEEAEKIGTIEWIYFEGGEAFLYYPLMLEGIRSASKRGFKTGVVSNAYYANSKEDTVKWLLPLKELGVKDLSISDDLFHNDGSENRQAKISIDTARELGINTSSITICEPSDNKDNTKRKKGEPVVGGDVMFRGRAADKLTNGLPRVNWKEFTECPYEELVQPERIHVDAYGHVHICQGISMGNMWETPLSDLVKNYNADKHPVNRFLIKGGPVKLTEYYKTKHEDSYVDACHLCYETRKKLTVKFPGILAPKQVYGL